MKDELTTKMHSEFTCSEEDEIRNRVFSVLTVADYSNKKQLKKYSIIYAVTLDDVDKDKDLFYRIKK